MDPSLALVVDRYYAEAATCTHTSTLIPITPLLKQMNERIFHQLLHYQQELDVFHANVVKKHQDENEKEKQAGASGSLSSPLRWEYPPPPPPPSSSLPYSPWFRGGASSAISTASSSSDAIPKYPENTTLTHYWYLQQIIPIPDVHQVSDYDTIYRFLLARHPPLPSSPAALHSLPLALEKAISMAVFDILHYIRFREMFDLNHILQDPFLTAELNGRDAMPLIHEALSLLDQYDPSHRVVAPSPTSSSSSSSTVPIGYIKLIEQVRSHLSRHVLYDAWRTWFIGVDLEGHVVLYQKPKPEELRALYKRWKYVEKGYDKSLDAFWTGSSSACLTEPPRIAGDAKSKGETKKNEPTALPGTAAAAASSSSTMASRKGYHDEVNFIARLYFRGMEKGRRISRLLHHAQQQAVDQHITQYMASHPSSTPIPSTGSPPSSHPPSTTTTGTTKASSSSSNPTRPLLSSSSPIYYASGSVTCLVDVSDVSVGTYTSSKYNEVVRMFKLLSLFGQSYYPDNMHRMIIINGGFIFRLLFKLIKPWLDPETQKKIIIVSSTNHYSVDELIENVDHIHLASPVRFCSPLSPCSNALDFPHFAPEEKVVDREQSTANLASETSAISSSLSDPSIPSEEEDHHGEDDPTTATDDGAAGNGPIATVEATSTAWNAARTLLACDASSGDSKPPTPLAGSLLLLSQTTTSIKKDQKYFDLFTSLSKYLPSTCIPSWYGGNLAMVFTPYHYGHLFGASGTVPAIALPSSSRIRMAEAGTGTGGACSGTTTSSAPPFIFPPQHGEGAAGVTLSSYPTTFRLPSPLPPGEKAGESLTPLARWSGEYACIQYLLSQLQQGVSVYLSSSSSTSVPLSEEETQKKKMTRETGKDTQEAAALPPSISALSFLRHHPAFLRSNVEKKYWQEWHTLLQHPRFSEALDAVLTFAPAEILPDTLFLPMLYVNHLQLLQRKTSAEPTFSSLSSSTSLWRSFCQQYLTGDGGNVCIGPVTDVEYDVFNAFLHYRYGEEKWSSVENKKK